ncbi:glycosyltransferase family 4 protein [Zobellia alginiliquefaciens]|uniref:glycosyltransferase family 4 protein n=1 Tax=Zobellia alginiliquefaciens TaxID=3032586 RepID=UPI0023E197BA|nr:glycosyltransferase family 4 protein [Zobellia alginiliquefaciens]
MEAHKKLTLVVVDLSVQRTSPAGSCILSELDGLANEYKIHLLANEADENLQEKLVFHKINSPNIPLFVRYMVFSNRVKTKMKEVIKQIEGPYVIQTTQGQYIDCTIAYPHFCHRAYLQKHWKKSSITGVRRVLRKLNHMYHARQEAKAFNKAKVIVTPSQGLARELLEIYPQCRDKIKIIANPVDVAHYKRPLDYKRNEQRAKLGLSSSDFVIAFAALGDFARKGLPELMESLTEDNALDSSHIKILVIGGKPKEIVSYKDKASRLGIENKMIFVGFQKDIRPYLWMSNIFALPSLYEIFSLVCIQAAAASLPIMVTKLHGVEEYLEHEKNGWLIERNSESIAKVLIGITQGKYDIEKMGGNAMIAATQYDHGAYKQQWKDIYKSLENEVSITGTEFRIS